MNFVSHHYFQSTSSGLYNAGLILADLIPLVRAKRVPLLPVVRNLIQKSHVPDEQLPLFRGMYAHFEADRIFHRSEFFLSAVDILSKDNMIVRAIPVILHHILVEMCMDRFLVIRDPSIASGMYDSFSLSYRPALEIISPHMPIGAEIHGICDAFSVGRKICGYTDGIVIAGGLKRIADNTGIRFGGTDDTVNATDAVIAAYNLLVESIAVYFESAKNIYRKIESDMK